MNENKVKHREHWRAVDKNGWPVGHASTAPVEPPLCCTDKRKDPTLRPVWPSGTLICPPEEQGCGSKWTKVN